MLKDAKKAQQEAAELELELTAIKNVLAALDGLEAPTKQRVLFYVLSKLRPEALAGAYPPGPGHDLIGCVR